VSCAESLEHDKFSLLTRGDFIMYIDETIIAGLLVVAGTVVFLGGFGYFAYKDAQKSKKS
jgi:hypothetical protein